MRLKRRKREFKRKKHYLKYDFEASVPEDEGEGNTAL